MQKQSSIFPLVICGALILLAVLLVIVGHRQGDSNAITAVTATAAASRAASPTPSAAAVAASALAKPAAAD